MDMGHLPPRRLHLLHIAFLALLTLVSVVPASPAVARRGDPPLDLPAMALRPVDFADEGRDGYGQSFSYMTDRQKKAAAFIQSLELDAGSPDGDIVSGTGAERSYLLQLGRLAPEESEMALYSQAAISFVLEFDGDGEAGDALQEMEERWLDAGYLDSVRRAQRIGDASFYLEGDAINPNSGNASDRTMLVFQVENIVAGVIVINFTDDDPPTQDLTENLALRQADRIQAVIDGDEGGGLSHMTLRLRVDGNDAWMDSYLAIDGEWFCEDGNAAEPGRCDERQDEVDDRQIENYYYVQQRVAGDWELEMPESYAWVFLRNFSSVEAAKADFQRLHAPDPGDKVMTDLALGDEAFGVLTPGDSWVNYTVIIRVGDMIATVGHRTETAFAAEQGWVFEPSEAGTLQLAEHQAACMDGTESCAKPVRIPREMIPAELAGHAPAPMPAGSVALAAPTHTSNNASRRAT